MLDRLGSVQLHTKRDGVITRIHEWTTLGKSPKKALTDFAQIISMLRQAMDELSLPDFLDQLVTLTGLEQALKGGKEEEQRRWDNVLELKRVASRFAGTQTPRALVSFLEHVALMSGADHAEGTKDPTKDRVTLITLHAAKGLEFHTVFIIGVEEQLIPHARTILDPDEASIEEERRLFYVGLTRAKEQLYCKYVRHWDFQRNSEMEAHSIVTPK